MQLKDKLAKIKVNNNYLYNYIMRLIKDFDLKFLQQV